MTEPTPNIHPEPRQDLPVLAWLLAFALMGWTGFWSFVILGGTLGGAWMGDATKMSISQHAILAMGLALLPVAGPPLLLGRLIRAPRPRAVVHILLWTTLAGTLLLIPRAIFPPVASYAPMLLRAAAGFLVGVILLTRAGRRGHLGRCDIAALGLGLAAGWGFLLPWLRYGALGNGWDVFVAGVQALALAFTLVGLSALLMPQLARTSSSVRRNLILGGMGLGTAFFVIGGSWGMMDYQTLLMPLLPLLGFPLALFGMQHRRYPAGAGLALAALTAFGPLAFVDPIELNVYNLITQEAAKWAFAALAWNLAWGVLLILATLILADALLRPRLGKAWMGLAGAVAAAAIAVYLLLGHPGFFGDDFFVVMKSQADLSPAREIQDVDARRRWVYETLATHAEREQADLRAWLDARGIAYTPYYLTNGIEVHASAIRRWQIAGRDDVDRILYSPELRPLPESPAPEPGDAAPPEASTWGLEAIRAPEVWEAFGVRGEGVVVGQSDSGVDVTHKALADNYRGERMGSHDYNWFDPWHGAPQPYDLNGHGTHTLSTVLGGMQVGVAPDAEWFACANLVRAFGSPAYYLACMQFMLAPWPLDGDPFQDGRPDLAADVSTNSWGCPPRLEGCDQAVLWPATRALRSAGIFFVAAAGNEGPACNSEQTPPGNYSNTILTVGAITPEGDLALFSSRGPETLSPDGARGPDLIAPGVDVLGAWPGDAWKRIEGTSMAAPHVAGVVALMWSANPALRGEVEATERILLESVQDYRGLHDDCGDPDQRPEASFGYGVVDAYEAVKRALAWGK